MKQTPLRKTSHHTPLLVIKVFTKTFLHSFQPVLPTAFRRILSIGLLLFLCLAVFAQPAINIRAAKSVIRTGEPDTLTLSASWPGHSLQQGFAVADSFPHFEVWDKGIATKTETGITQTIVVTGYDSGRFSLPPLPLIENPKAASDSFAISIQPVNVDTLKDYHDIKDIIEVPATPQWPYIIGLALATVGSIVGLYFLLQKKKQVSAIRRMPKAGAYQRAIEALQQLEKQTDQPGPAKPFFTALTGIYRQYLSEAWRWRSLQQTGGELILQAKSHLPETDFYNLTNAIRLSDAAKFAKYQPPQPDWHTALTAIRQTVEAMEKQLQQSREHERFKPQVTKNKAIISQLGKTKHKISR